MTVWKQASLLGLAVTAILIVTSTGTPNCLSCSYVLTPDPTLGSECITDPYNYVKTINLTCNFATHWCYVKVSYELGGYKTVRSLMRSCDLKSWPGFAGMPNGCSKEDQYQSCIYKCESDFCNDGDGNLYETHYQFTTPAPPSAGGTMPVFLIWTLAACLALHGS